MIAASLFLTLDPNKHSRCLVIKTTDFSSPHVISQNSWKPTCLEATISTPVRYQQDRKHKAKLKEARDILYAPYLYFYEREAGIKKIKPAVAPKLRANSI